MWTTDDARRPGRGRIARIGQLAAALAVPDEEEVLDDEFDDEFDDDVEDVSEEEPLDEEEVEDEDDEAEPFFAAARLSVR